MIINCVAWWCTGSNDGLKSIWVQNFMNQIKIMANRYTKIKQLK